HIVVAAFEVEIPAGIDAAEIARAPPAPRAVVHESSGGRLWIAPDADGERGARDQDLAGLTRRHFIARTATGHDDSQIAVEHGAADADEAFADHLLGGDAGRGRAGLGRAVHLDDVRADFFPQ